MNKETYLRKYGGEQLYRLFSSKCAPNPMTRYKGWIVKVCPQWAYGMGCAAWDGKRGFITSLSLDALILLIDELPKKYKMRRL